MDFLAKRYWNSDQSRCLAEWGKRSKGFATVRINKTEIVSSLRKSIHKEVGFQRWWNWWAECQIRNGKQAVNVDFHNIGLAFSSLSILEKIFVMKQAHGTCGVGTWMVKWKESTTAACPRCGYANEDMIHVWKCQKSAKWGVVLSKWKQWLRKHNCPEKDRIAFCNEWVNWRGGKRDQSLSLCTPLLRNAIEDQRRINWDNLSKGYLSKEWSVLFKSWKGNKYQVSVPGFLRLIWSAGKDMWEERNEPLHNQGNISDQRKQKEINQAIIREHQRDHTLLGEIDSRLYSEPLEEVLARSRNGKRDWLLRVHTAQARKRRRIGEATTRDMRDEFIRDQLLITNWSKKKFF